MLPEEVVKDGPILLVYPLHLVDVLCHLLHCDERLSQLLLLIRPQPRQVLELRQQQWVLEDALDRLDQVRLQCRRLLLTRVQRLQKVLEGVVAVI